MFQSQKRHLESILKSLKDKQIRWAFGFGYFYFGLRLVLSGFGFWNSNIRCVHCKSKAFRRRNGEVVKCFECQIPLGKKDMMEKSWGQMQIENEIRIRNNLREEFDSKPEDFDSAREYYEYMEELEEMGRKICC